MSNQANAQQGTDAASADIDAVIDNQTGMPHLWFEQSGPEGERLDVLVVRGTFDFASYAAPMKLAHQQMPVEFGETYDGVEQTDVLRAAVVDDGDLVLYKPGTDILVRGSAIAPGRRAHTTWLAGVRVGQTEKIIRLHGPRHFCRTRTGWRVTVAAPVTSVLLDYRLAFGGALLVPAALCAADEPEALKHPGNPAGRGWLPTPTQYRDLPEQARAYVRRWVGAQNNIPAPQVEDPTEPVLDPFSLAAAHGLGPVARWWSPRVGLQGTFDEQWRRTRFPLLPTNFDSRYFQAAPHDLIASPHLRGDESVTLVGLLPERRDMRLPGWHIVVVATRASGACTVHVAPLDTVRFNLATCQATLVWRAHFTHEADPVVDVVLATTSAELTRGTSTLEQTLAVAPAKPAGTRV